MNVCRQAAWVILAAVSLVSCSDSMATRADVARLADLERQYQDRFAFRLHSDTYLDARFLKGGIPSEGEARRIYEAFWFAHHQEPRPDSAFTYLNIYDERGAFQFQLYYDPETHHILRSNKERY